MAAMPDNPKQDNDPMCLLRLREALMVASLPAEKLIASFSPKLNVPYEIADDLGHWIEWAHINAMDVVFTSEQLSTLQQLDALLCSMSGEQNEPLWTDEALRRSPEWNEVRALAKRSVGLLG